MQVETPQKASNTPIKFNKNIAKSIGKIITRKVSTMTEEEDSLAGLSIPTRPKVDWSMVSMSRVNALVSPVKVRGLLPSNGDSPKKPKTLYTLKPEDSRGDLEGSELKANQEPQQGQANKVPSIMVKAGYHNPLANKPKMLHIGLKSATEVLMNIANRSKESNLHSPRGAVQEIDLLYFPSNIYSEVGEKKLFTPFKSLKYDPEYVKTTSRLSKNSSGRGSAIKPAIIMREKLEWNSAARDQQQQILRTMGNKSYGHVLESCREWKEKTKRLPLIIKRKGYERRDSESSDSEIAEETNQGLNLSTSRSSKQVIKPPQKHPSERLTLLKAEGLVLPHVNISGATNLSFQLPPVDERLFKIRDLPAAWVTKHKPRTGQGFSVDAMEGRTCVAVNDQVFIFGGASASFSESVLEMYSFSTNKTQPVMLANKQVAPRAFHTCDYWEEHLVIFGGETFGQVSNSRLLCNELLFINTKNFEVIKTLVSPQDLEPRKFHASCIVANYLLVTGGVDEEARTLNSAWLFNLSKHCLM
jgi:Kelch motif